MLTAHNPLRANYAWNGLSPFVDEPIETPESLGGCSLCGCNLSRYNQEPATMNGEPVCDPCARNHPAELDGAKIVELPGVDHRRRTLFKSQLGIMQLLKREGHLSVPEISRMLRSNSSTIGNHVNKLMRWGLVKNIGWEPNNDGHGGRRCIYEATRTPGEFLEMVGRGEV